MRIAVAVPCYNEAPTIAKVVRDFRRELPEAEIVVFDNGSTDASAEEARLAGAAVVRETRRGKGYVIQAIFESLDADAVVVVDGDDTYFAEDVHALLAPIMEERADMVVGNRLKGAPGQGLGDLRRFGNQVIIRIVNLVFRTSFQDVLSGFRVMSRNFRRRVPLSTGGFEIETELTLQALEKGMVVEEVPIRYRERPWGSISKLSPFADGYRILIAIAMFLRNHRPLFFFSWIAGLTALLAVVYSALWAFGGLPAVPGLWHGLVVAALGAAAGALVIAGVMRNAIHTGFRERQSLPRRSR